MAVFEIALFKVRNDAHLDAERAMHAFATFVRTELPQAAWNAYRDAQDPGTYIAVSRADSPAAGEAVHASAGARTFTAAIEPLLVGEIERSEYQLVTSSDLARRHKPAR